MLIFVLEAINLFFRLRGRPNESTECTEGVEKRRAGKWGRKKKESIILKLKLFPMRISKLSQVCVGIFPGRNFCVRFVVWSGQKVSWKTIKI